MGTEVSEVGVSLCLWDSVFMPSEKGHYMARYTLLYLKWITNKELLHSICSMLCGSLDCGGGVQGRMKHESISCSVVSDSLQLHGLSPARSPGEGWIHVYVWLSPFTVHLKLS